MSQIRVLLCQVDEQNPEQMTELASFDIAEVAGQSLRPETALDDLEARTQASGQAILRRLFQIQWEGIDAQLAEQYRQRFSPSSSDR